MSEPVVKWADEEPQSYQDAVISMLKFMDEALEEEGWDIKPTIGVVSLTRLESLDALSVQVPAMPDSFYEKFDTALSILAKLCLEAETEDNAEYQGFLNEGITKDFVGWLASGEFYSTKVNDDGVPIGEPVEQRIIMFVDLESNKYGVVRNRGDDHSKVMSDVSPNPLLKSLSMLVAASIMSILRRSLLEPSED